MEWRSGMIIFDMAVLEEQKECGIKEKVVKCRTVRKRFLKKRTHGRKLK
jgi:hypothetical protein